ncbi:MAG: DMT family transporter [Actinomycetota bacterium]|nr:DMT family transporter [Actinomycetota bacterium]
MEVILALGAALLFALATVLQQKEAAAAPDHQALRAGFLLKLARRPVWLAGMATDMVGYVCQAAALGIGRLAVVQPLLATMVIFALPIGAKVTGHRTTRREVACAAVVAAGLGAFLVLADPGGGRSDATALGWTIVGAVSAPLCVALVMLSRGRAPALKATLLGIATGILWGISAALTKAVVDHLDEGVLQLLVDWHVYALVVVGWASLTLAQASLQTGALAPAIATQATMDPIASVVIGTLAFHESIHASTVGVVGAALALTVMLAGLAVLAAAQQTVQHPPPFPSPEGGAAAARARAIIPGPP